MNEWVTKSERESERERARERERETERQRETERLDKKKTPQAKQHSLDMVLTQPFTLCYLFCPPILSCTILSPSVRGMCALLLLWLVR